jgi:hypothetical protein
LYEVFCAARFSTGVFDFFTDVSDYCCARADVHGSNNKNYVWTWLENAGRSNELELTPGTALPVGFTESPVGHVAAYTLGYDRDFAIGKHLLAAPGAQLTVYRTPAALQGIYGDTPTGEVVFVRFRLR